MDKIINLTAFLLPLGIFIYFGCVGYAALNVLRTQRNTLQNVLLSPAIGIAFTLLPIFCLNRLGLPVRTFAIPLTLFLFITSLLTFYFRKPIFPFKRYCLFVLIFLLALFLTGRPLLFYGFDWISYANDDMANYCLAALRFLNHGYSDVPNANVLAQGTDYSQYYWFTYVPGLVRPGSELLLANLTRITDLAPLKLFMPFIISFHLILISSTGALILLSKRWYRVALVTCLFLVFSALTTLGTLYQLVAQVLGLSLLITTAILLFQTLTITRSYLYKHSVLLSIVGCTLLIGYPELIPILGAAFIFYFVTSCLKGWKPTKRFFIVFTICILLSLIFLNKYWINIISFIHVQSGAGLTHQKGNLFPYFLMPSGFANLWGLQTLALFPQEPWASISIVLGFILCLFTLLLLIIQIPKRYPATMLALAMVTASFYLAIHFRQASGFSLFKLAMYSQPFLLGVLAIGLFNIFSIRKLKWIGMIAIVLLTVMGFPAQKNYLQDSFGELGKPFSELPNGTITHLPSELDQLSKTIAPDTRVISDTTSIISSKLQSSFLKNKETFFYSNYFFIDLPYTGTPFFKHAMPEAYLTSYTLLKKASQAELKLSFIIKNPNETSIANYFYKPYFDPKTTPTILLMDTPLRNVFNRQQLYLIHDKNYITQPLDAVSNHLIFINSSLGQHYDVSNAQHISLYGLEKDYFYPTQTTAGIGRYLLFQMIHPSNKIHLEVNLTETLNSHGIQSFPKAEIMGIKNTPLHFIGRGSARIFSDNFTPRIIQNDPYFMLNMQQNGTNFQTEHKGLMKLFGNNVSLDSRSLVGFIRDISLISDEDYQNLKAPSLLKKFPDDLNDPNLEYSGIYEDGWISEDSFFKLSQPKHSKLILDGMLPAIEKQDNTTFVTLYVDDKKLLEKQIHPGDFHFLIDIPKANLKRNLRLHFGHYFSLPGSNRIVAAKLNRIGFQPEGTPPTSIKKIPEDLDNPTLEYSGIYKDGWISSEDALFKLTQFQDSKLMIEGSLPAFEKQKTSTVLTLFVDNKKITEKPIHSGYFHFLIDVPGTRHVRNIRLHFSNHFVLPSGDGRKIAVFLNKIGFEKV